MRSPFIVHYRNGVTDSLRCFGLEKVANNWDRVRELAFAGDLTGADALANKLKQTSQVEQTPVKSPRDGSIVQPHPPFKDSNGLYTIPNAVDLGVHLQTLGGASSEGAPALMAHPDPQLGVNVTKIYNPEGITTPEGIAAKERFHGLNHPNLLRMRGKTLAPGVPLPIHHFDFVPGGLTEKALRNQNKWTPDLEQQKAWLINDIRRAAQQQGLDFMDPNQQNIMLHPNLRRLLMIDALPHRLGRSHLDTYRIPAGAVRQFSTKDVWDRMYGQVLDYDFEAPIRNRLGKIIQPRALLSKVK